jgi:hypothetical protein
LIEARAAAVGCGSAVGRVDLQDAGEASPQTAELAARDRTRRCRPCALRTRSDDGTQGRYEGLQVGFGLSGSGLGTRCRIEGGGGSGNLFRLHHRA